MVDNLPTTEQQETFGHKLNALSVTDREISCAPIVAALSETEEEDQLLAVLGPTRKRGQDFQNLLPSSSLPASSSLTAFIPESSRVVTRRGRVSEPDAFTITQVQKYLKPTAETSRSTMASTSAATPLVASAPQDSAPSASEQLTDSLTRDGASSRNLRARKSVVASPLLAAPGLATAPNSGPPMPFGGEEAATSSMVAPVRSSRRVSDLAAAAAAGKNPPSALATRTEAEPEEKETRSERKPRNSEVIESQRSNATEQMDVKYNSQLFSVVAMWIMSQSSGSNSLVDKDGRRCTNCRKAGHDRRNCPLPRLDASGALVESGRACAVCGSSTHDRRTCPIQTYRKPSHGFSPRAVRVKTTAAPKAPSTAERRKTQPSSAAQPPALKKSAQKKKLQEYVGSSEAGVNLDSLRSALIAAGKEGAPPVDISQPSKEISQRGSPAGKSIYSKTPSAVNTQSSTNKSSRGRPAGQCKDMRRKAPEALDDIENEAFEDVPMADALIPEQYTAEEMSHVSPAHKKKFNTVVHKDPHRRHMKLVTRVPTAGAAGSHAVNAKGAKTSSNLHRHSQRAEPKSGNVDKAHRRKDLSVASMGIEETTRGEVRPSSALSTPSHRSPVHGLRAVAEIVAAKLSEEDEEIMAEWDRLREEWSKEKRLSLEAQIRSNKPSTAAGKFPPALPYDIKALHWNGDGSENAQQKYCYCGRGKTEEDVSVKPMINCGRCRQLFHFECVSSRVLDNPFLVGDSSYCFRCALCNRSSSFSPLGSSSASISSKYDMRTEFLSKARQSWVTIARVTLCNLLLRYSGRGGDEYLAFPVVPHMVDFVRQHYEQFSLPEVPEHSEKLLLEAITSNPKYFKRSSARKNSWTLTSAGLPQTRCGLPTVVRLLVLEAEDETSAERAQGQESEDSEDDTPLGQRLSTSAQKQKNGKANSSIAASSNKRPYSQLVSESSVKVVKRSSVGASRPAYASQTLKHASTEAMIDKAKKRRSVPTYKTSVELSTTTIIDSTAPSTSAVPPLRRPIGRPKGSTKGAKLAAIKDAIAKESALSQYGRVKVKKGIKGLPRSKLSSSKGKSQELDGSIVYGPKFVSHAGLKGRDLEKEDVKEMDQDEEVDVEDTSSDEEMRASRVPSAATAQKKSRSLLPKPLFAQPLVKRLSVRSSQSNSLSSDGEDALMLLTSLAADEVRRLSQEELEGARETGSDDTSSYEDQESEESRYENENINESLPNSLSSSPGNTRGVEDEESEEPAVYLEEDDVSSCEGFVIQSSSSDRRVVPTSSSLAPEPVAGDVVTSA